MDERPTEVEGPGFSPAQMWHYFRRYPYILAKVALWGLAILGVFFVMRSVESVLFPILVSLLIAYLLDPTIDWFEERGISRTIAIAIFMAIGVVFVALFALVLYPTIAAQATNVMERLPILVSTIQEDFLPWLETRFGIEVPASASAAMAEYGETVKEQLPNVAKRASEWAAGLLAKTGPIIASILNIVMIPVFTFYFLRDFDKMRLDAARFIPLKGREVFVDRMRKADVVVGAWFRGQVEVACILAACYAVGLGALFGFVGIGLVSGVAIGILTGLLNIVPYFGVLIGIVLSTLIVLIDWHGIGPLLGVGAVFGVVQLLEGYVITPKIVGEKVGLSPVVVIIVLLLGGELFGLLGVLLAIPIAGVVRVLLPDIIEYYKKSPFFTGELAYDLSNPVELEDPSTQPDPISEESTPRVDKPQDESVTEPPESPDELKEDTPEPEPKEQVESSQEPDAPSDDDDDTDDVSG